VKKIDALLKLQKSGRNIFSSVDLQKLLRTESGNTACIQANRLTNDRILERIAKGVYCLKDSKPDDFETANFLYKPSYISLESALAYYGILLQVPHSITSVTPKRAKKISSKGKEFVYSHLAQNYYSDYVREKLFVIATPEKAIIDIIFFACYGRTVIHPDEWVWDNVNKKRLKKVSAEIKSRVFHNFFNSLKLY